MPQKPPEQANGKAKEELKGKQSIKQRFVTADETEMRLDRWLRRHFPFLTQGHVQKLLRTGQIRVDGKRAEAADRLDTGQVIRIPPHLEAERQASKHQAKDAPFLSSAKRARLQAMVLFEDDDVLVLNKPAGLAVQGGTGIKESLDDLLMAFSLDGHDRPKLVHRLDRETSGVLLIARTAFAAAHLAEAFRLRTTQKIYWAVTLGIPKPPTGEIDAPLVKNGEIMRVATPADHDAKKAVTLYQTVEKVKNKLAFVALAPLTGRTHQLRVHLASLGTPILGDRLYGGQAPAELATGEIGQGLHLHARRLIIPHPRRGVIDVTAPLSPTMQKTWEWSGFDSTADISFADALPGRRKRLPL